MPGNSFDSESQDSAEAFDESNTAGDDAPLDTEAGMRTFEDLPDVQDLTRRAGDRDDDEALMLGADEFDVDAVTDADLEEDDELNYPAADEEREDDLDGLGAEDPYDAGVSRGEIEGLEEVGDAADVVGAEDDFTNFESRTADDDDLENLGYSKRPDGGSKR